MRVTVIKKKGTNMSIMDTFGLTLNMDSCGIELKYCVILFMVLAYNAIQWARYEKVPRRKKS